ncbi:MAG: 3'-5' exoribonuclease [Desulfovibrio sp.]|nr:3'-5' exoribonuclease [Desulfovibrio sp.]
MTPVSASETTIYVAIDFETCGYAAHAACSVGLARIEGERITATFYSLIRPPSSRILFSDIHGLTWPMLREAPFFVQVWQQALPLLADAHFFLAHNAAFDRRVLHAACRAAGLTPPSTPFLCTLKGARRCLPLPSKKLDMVCSHFGIDLEHHHAASDARACAEVYLRLRDLGVADRQMAL